MSKCLIVLDHSFRLNSLLIKTACDNYDQVSFVYPSNWYWSSAARSLYKNTDISMHKEALNHFACSLKEKLNIDLYILKSAHPEKDIQEYCQSNKIDKVLYDMPLFSKDSLDIKNVCLEVIDSDSYDPSCLKMTAKSRWVYWAKNRKDIQDVKFDHKTIKSFGGLGEVYQTDKALYEKSERYIKSLWERVEEKILTYHTTRNMRNGSTQISTALHHGLIDARQLTHILLSLAPDFIEKGNVLVPLLRQLAFREISILKARSKNMSMFDTAEQWSMALLDKASQDNLKENTFQPDFFKEELFSGQTNNPLLNAEVLNCKEKRWMPNRLRMWFAGECYWGLGGGYQSLETLIQFFNEHTDDAQSPNNYISCVESMRLKYGKVMRFNEKRTFKLIEGKEII